MKKRSFYSLVFLAMVAVLSACGHEHTFAEATCTEPAVCTECGETEGEPLGHDWKEATCTEPKTCTRCGAVEGEAAGHDWKEATCTEPKTCAKCGETEGKPLEHEWTYATLDAPKTCTLCGLTEGDPVVCEQNDTIKKLKEDSKWDRIICFENTILCRCLREGDDMECAFYDYDGKLIKDMKLSFKGDFWGYGYGLGSYDSNIGCYGSWTQQDNSIDVIIYDQKGEELLTHHIDKLTDHNEYLYGYVNLFRCTDKRYYAVCFVQEDKSSVLEYFDSEKMEFFDGDDDDFVLAKDAPLEYDEDKYSYCVKMTGKAGDELGGYFVSNADESLWGYLDENFNELKMYADATDFNPYGYALVSDDRKTYSIIDTDFNVVAKDYFTGDSSYTSGKYIIVGSGDSLEYYLIH